MSFSRSLVRPVAVARTALSTASRSVVISAAATSSSPCSSLLRRVNPCKINSTNANNKTNTSVSSSLAARFASTNTKSSNAMFCFQCEQTNNGTGCTVVGVCGKQSSTASLQNIVECLTKGTALWLDAAREIYPAVLTAETRRALDSWMLHSLFATMTNVNFDDVRMLADVREGVSARSRAQLLFDAACRAKNIDPVAEAQRRGLTTNFFATTASMPSTTTADAVSTLTTWARSSDAAIDVRQQKYNPDVVGLQEMVLYGLKGTAAYAAHADALGKLTTNENHASIIRDFWATLAIIAKPNVTVDELLGAALLTGDINLRVMSALDSAICTTFGTPVPTVVNCTPLPGKCILVSGHDLGDLEEILKQTDGKGINVYTHGEMLPAHSYPKLKAYKHLAGHYGGPWQLQKFEFGAFPGSIVMTSNCLIEPLKLYKKRIFTRSVTGFSGVTHLPTQDYAPAIEAALAADGFNGDADELKVCSRPNVTIGFGHSTILSVADKVIDGVKQGKITRFFYIGGCDGSEGERSYFTDLAAATPADTMILTAGCGKFRINRIPTLAQATIDVGNGVQLPRLLDMGQCNDSYSGIVVADALRKAFGLKHVNELPLSFAVSWFEQKAVAIFCSLLKLGIQNIHLGPNLPGFATPNMARILIDKFGLQKTNHKDVRGDLARMMAGK